MPIYLFRHGEAYQIGEREGIHSDEDRPLTPKGHSVTAGVCTGLKRLKVQCDRIWHSPLVRAEETASIVSQEMGCSVVEMKEGLAFDAASEDLFQSLKDLNPIEGVFLIGHQPCLGEWTVRLISGRVTDEVSVSKSGVVCLDVLSGTNPSMAQLRWLLRAKHLQMIGKTSSV